MTASRGLLIALLFAVSTSTGQTGAARGLTLEDRIAAQRAIEQVYWSHRIWPTDNATPKPSLDAVMPESAIHAKVEDYLLKSDALEKLWGHPITAAELQSEMERMATHTRAGDVLREIFDALGNDPSVIAETLARESLADRLVRNWYARDRRFRDAVRARAESALATHGGVAELRSAGVAYAERIWRLSPDPKGSVAPGPDDGTSMLAPDEWAAQMSRLAAPSLPKGVLGALREDDDSSSVTAILEKSTDTLTVATLSWPKVTFDAWWAARRPTLSASIAAPPGEFSAVTPRDPACTPDTWAATQPGAADPREHHSAVWTGTEMIVWGGYAGQPNGYLSTGGRYNPATDTWTATPNGPDTPSGRQSHGAVWTGTEMIVWGGVDAHAELGTGGRYDPLTNAWRPTAILGAPEPRSGPTVFWTGSRVLVWGGSSCISGCQPLRTGGLYDPLTDSWSPTNASASAPSTRYSYSAIWTGSAMIVWGGNNGSPSAPMQSGARYDPVSDSWQPTSTGANVPSPRYEHTSVWTGSEMLVWGGRVEGTYLVTGGRYNPLTDTWASMSAGADVPSGRSGETSVWDGHRMIVWGGYAAATSYPSVGGRYDPATDTWTPTSTGPNAAAPREHHTAVWTGDEMIVWGGYEGGVGWTATGSRYSPGTDTWVPTGMGAAPSARALHAAVWTGTEMVVWGGVALYGVEFTSGGRYTPATDSWSATSVGPDVPVARREATAVWTGTEMIVWGGQDGTNCLNTGGRYNPATNTWRATNATVAPTARRSHTAVWTGREMIVWGGTNIYPDIGLLLRTGSRYDPSSDSWLPTSVGSGGPLGRVGHSAVFVSGRMVVWGGIASDAFNSNSGSRYDPSSDTWTSTSVAAGVPQGRTGHTAIAAGGKMIVWAGSTTASVNSGGVYDPAADLWSPTSTSTNVPLGRWNHTAIWTGTEMIVWGGYAQPGNVAKSGGRYDLATNSWLPTSEGANVPIARESHTAVWTGQEMLVWGGSPITATGGRYCACPAGRLVYRDADGDGFGDAAVSAPSCDGSAPAGYVVDHTDCNDAAASMHPGATEICNAIDDDCNGLVDDSVSGEDSDADAIHDACDNCPFVANTTQSDFDHDGQGDVCDLNDGLIYEWRSNTTSMSWQAEQGPASWNVYTGDLAVLRSTGVYTQVPGSNPLASRQCGVIATAADDLAIPAAGKVSYSLVTGVTSGVEGSLGSNGSGVRPNANPCP